MWLRHTLNTISGERQLCLKQNLQFSANYILYLTTAIQQSLMLMMITASFSGLDTLCPNVFRFKKNKIRPVLQLIDDLLLIEEDI